MGNDYFKHLAEDYERVDYRVDNVENIARAVSSRVKLDKDMHILDFGSGTGLLLEKVAGFVGKITAVDISPSMNQQLNKKRDALGCDLEILEMDLSRSPLNRQFDGIISSMTMHHVEDIKAMFERFHAMLHDGGFVAIADLDQEDGSFHTEDTGVFHLGFDRAMLERTVEACGFKDIEVALASMVRKPQRDYPVFLLTAYR